MRADNHYKTVSITFHDKSLRVAKLTKDQSSESNDIGHYQSLRIGPPED